LSLTVDGRCAERVDPKQRGSRQRIFGLPPLRTATGGCRKDPREGGGATTPSLGIALGDALDASRSHQGGVIPAIVTDRHRRSSTGSCVRGLVHPPTSRPSPTWPSVSHCAASLALAWLPSLRTAWMSRGSGVEEAPHGAEGGLARPIGLPATCQLQSIAKPLSVDANAVP
jgi:hypothetical protein